MVVCETTKVRGAGCEDQCGGLEGEVEAGRVARRKRPQDGRNERAGQLACRESSKLTHCGSMSASLTTCAHFTISAAMCVSSSSGVLVIGWIANP